MVLARAHHIGGDIHSCEVPTTFAALNQQFKARRDAPCLTMLAHAFFTLGSHVSMQPAWSRSWRTRAHCLPRANSVRSSGTLSAGACKRIHTNALLQRPCWAIHLLPRCGRLLCGGARCTFLYIIQKACCRLSQLLAREGCCCA